jgi:hypothetical protein
MFLPWNVGIPSGSAGRSRNWDNSRGIVYGSKFKQGCLVSMFPVVVCAEKLGRKPSPYCCLDPNTVLALPEEETSKTLQYL